MIPNSTLLADLAEAHGRALLDEAARGRLTSMPPLRIRIGLMLIRLAAHIAPEVRPLVHSEARP